MNPERIAENLNIFDFTLTDGEMAVTDGLDKGEAGRVGPNPDVFDWMPAVIGERP